MEVNDSSMSVLAEGRGGPKPCILNKIVNTFYGQRRNNIYISEFILSNCQHRTFFTRIRASSRIGPHNEDVISLLVGSLLGDSVVNKEWIVMVCTIFAKINDSLF